MNVSWCSCFDISVTKHAPTNVRNAEIICVALTVIALAATIYFRNLASWSAPTFSMVTASFAMVSLYLEKKRRAFNRKVTIHDIKNSKDDSKKLLGQLKQATNAEKMKTVNTIFMEGGNLFHLLAATPVKEEDEVDYEVQIMQYKTLGLNINAQEKAGKLRTPLHIAFEKNNQRMISLFKKHGAREDIPNKEQKFPHECAPPSNDDE